MPAERIKPGTGVSDCDVLGFFASASEDAIRHVGLAGQNQILRTATDALGVTHMQPPLLREHRAAEFVGSTHLETPARQKIRTFLDERLAEHEAARQRKANTRLSSFREYTIYPAFERRTKAHASDKYSCAGFVQKAYAQARINLTVSEESLPEVSLDTIMKVYSAYAASLARPRLRRVFGLEGDGPWRVLFPGYLMKSLDRNPGQILAEPYQPIQADIHFQPL